MPLEDDTRLGKQRDFRAHDGYASSSTPQPLGFIEPDCRYRHGTLSGYSAGKCRCQHCKDIYADYRARRREAGKDSRGRRRTINTDGHIPGLGSVTTSGSQRSKRPTSASTSAPTTSATPTRPGSWRRSRPPGREGTPRPRQHHDYREVPAHSPRRRRLRTGRLRQDPKPLETRLNPSRLIPDGLPGRVPGESPVRARHRQAPKTWRPRNKTAHPLEPPGRGHTALQLDVDRPCLHVGLDALRQGPHRGHRRVRASAGIEPGTYQCQVRPARAANTSRAVLVCPPVSNVEGGDAPGCCRVEVGPVWTGVRRGVQRSSTWMPCAVSISKRVSRVTAGPCRWRSWPGMRCWRAAAE